MLPYLTGLLHTSSKPSSILQLLVIGSTTSALTFVLLRYTVRQIRHHLLHRDGMRLNEVLFTNRRSNCCIDAVSARCRNRYCRARNERRVMQLIESARHSVSLSMYFFTYHRLGDTIIAAHQRGVRVRVIGCKSMAFSQHSQLLRMAGLAIPVRFPNDTLMLVHHKFCLIDAEQPQSPTPRLVYGSPAAVPAAVQSGAPIRLPKGGVLLNGSMNWTMQGLSGNWENILITSSPELIGPFVDEFNAMWQDFEQQHHYHPGRRVAMKTTESESDAVKKTATIEKE